jgi:hypothetical protein
MTRPDAPRSTAAGEIDAMDGFALTVKHDAHVTVPPSGFVTVTARAPVVAVGAMEIVALNEDGSTSTEPTLIPEPANETTAPSKKFVPLIVITWSVVPWARDAGDAEVIVGVDFTVKHSVHVALPVSGFVTVTPRLPIVASDAME